MRHVLKAENRTIRLRTEARPFASLLGLNPPCRKDSMSSQTSKQPKRRKKASPRAQPAPEPQPEPSEPKKTTAPTRRQQEEIEPGPPFLQSPQLKDIVEAQNAEAILEEIVPGIAKDLKKEEIIHLLRISEQLPAWNALALRRLQEKPQQQSQVQDGTKRRPFQKDDKVHAMTPDHENDKNQKEDPGNLLNAPKSSYHLVKSGGHAATNSRNQAEHTSRQHQSDMFSIANRFDTLNWSEFPSASEEDKSMSYETGAKQVDRS